MKKLVILPSKKTEYFNIFLKIKELKLSNITFIYHNKLDLKLIKKYDIIIFQKLNNTILKKVSDYKIVIIQIDNYKTYNQLVDIFIDPFFKQIQKSVTNFVKGSFQPIQLDFNNNTELNYILNVITLLDWDTKFWKKKICFIGPKRLTSNIIFRCNKFIRKNNPQMVQYLANCHDANSIKIAESNNFAFKDIRITLNKKVNFFKKKIKKNITFKKATIEDYKLIRDTAIKSYKESRYYFDDHFPLKKVKEFYSGWLKKAILGKFDDICFLICFKNKPVGFCTLRINNNYAQIGLFSISEQYQNRGFSKLLLNYVENELYKLNISNLSVVTQARNHRALEAYQVSGFKIYRTEIWYHKWIV